MKNRVIRWVIVGGLFFMIAMMGTKLAYLYRTSSGIAAIRLVKTAVQLPKVFEAPLMSFYPTDFCFGLLCAGLLWLVVWVKRKNRKKYRQNEEYGSARWGTPAEIAPFMDENPRNNMILTRTESLSMKGRMSKPKYGRNKNVMVIGGSGSGKTRYFLKPSAPLRAA